MVAITTLTKKAGSSARIFSASAIGKASSSAENSATRKPADKVRKRFYFNLPPQKRQNPDQSRQSRGPCLNAINSAIFNLNAARTGEHRFLAQSRADGQGITGRQIVHRILSHEHLRH